MSFNFFSLLPSTDIHLILNPKPPLGRKLQLKVDGYDESTPNINDLTSSCTYTILDSSIATESNGKLNPVKEGRTFLTVTFLDGTTGNSQNLVARVWVHNSISEVWLGNNSASVNRGSANYVVSVYAKFDSGDIGDITGHGYVEIQSLDPDNATIDLPSGRVTGISQPPIMLLQPSITLRAKSGSYGQLDQDIILQLKPSLKSPREIVEPVWFKGSDPQLRNILFLAEGFDNTEKKKFEMIVKTIAKRMTRSKIHQPFKLLKQDYNIWMAFEASQEKGVTLGFPTGEKQKNLLVSLSSKTNKKLPGMYSLFNLVELLGLPTVLQSSLSIGDAKIQFKAQVPEFLVQKLDAGILKDWQKFASKSILQTKNSSLGLMFGTRLGDIRSSNSPVLADNSWYHKSSPNLFIDPRRMKSNLLFWYKDFFNYLGSLRTKRGSNDPNFKIGEKWKLHGPDQGLVVILANDNFYGKINTRIINNSEVLNIFAATSINGAEIIKSFAPNINSSALDFLPNTSIFIPEVIVGTSLHELGHSMFLGDEYEDIRNKKESLNPTKIEFFDNLTTTPGLDLLKNKLGFGTTKWQAINRASQSSGILNEAQNVSSSNKIRLDLFKGEGKKWKVGNIINLRTRNINVLADFNKYPPFRKHRSFELTNLNITGVSVDKLELSGIIPPDISFPRGSMIYIPKKHQEADLNLVLPGVIDFMFVDGTKRIPLKDKRGSPFGVNVVPDCDTANIDIKSLPFEFIPKVLLTKDRERLIGLYEGGGTHNCNVFRPTGKCKMRDQVALDSAKKIVQPHFCHICKHTIVNEINPSKHSLLDNDYPGKPV